MAIFSEYSIKHVQDPNHKELNLLVCKVVDGKSQSSRVIIPLTKEVREVLLILKDMVKTDHPLIG